MNNIVNRSSTAVLLPCRFDGHDQPGAPRVWALRTARLPGDPHAERAAARHASRAALTEVMAAELGCAPDALRLSHRRGQAPQLSVAPGARASSSTADLVERLVPLRVSIAHATAWSLIAWHRGPVGVDLQDRAALHGMSAVERGRLAALYFGPEFEPNQPSAPAGTASEAIKEEAFMALWGRHEACLKCLGQPLQEWSPTLQRRLAACTVRALVLPPALANAAPGWAAALAWQDPV